MPYQKDGGKMWYCRVRTRGGRTAIHPTGTPLRNAAVRVEAWVKEVRGNLDKVGILDAIIDKRITLADAYALGEEGVRAKFEAEAIAAADTNMTPLLTEFIEQKRKATRGSASADDYERQIRALFPATPFLRSQMTVPSIARRLDALPHSDPTKNRYRAALSGFCRWLVRRGDLQTNPAREVGGYTERDGRDVWYDRETSLRVLRAIVGDTYRAREALMCATGMDWSDCTRLRVRDLDLKTLEVRCHGSKTKYRNRTIRITERDLIPLIRPALANKLPDAMVFEGGHRAAIKWHHRAVKAAKAPPSTLHDWRHTYAVNALKQGQPATVVAHQLGHRDANLVWTRYGRFVPGSADYKEQTEAIQADPSTKPATEPKTQHAS